MAYTLHEGDSAVVLKQYPDNYFHSIVTDPPYFIEVFNQKWDGKATDLTPVFKECFRTLRPGGYMIAFSSSKTYHKTISMLMSAGFDIEDMLVWQHEQGFPKSQDIGKKVEALRLTGKANMRAIKEAACIQAGIEYETEFGIHQKRLAGKPSAKFNHQKDRAILHHDNEWSGWYTDIKQTIEPIALAQKPIEGNSAVHNCVKWNAGALNITEAGQDDKLCGNIFRYSKPSKEERNAGLDEDTDHPTVKPIDLMRSLITLVTPKSGIVLDPFLGSGSTGIAALELDREFIGIEKEPKYLEISKKRIEHFANITRTPQKSKFSFGV